MTAQQFRPYKVTAAHRIHIRLGASWTQCGEWRLPEAFGDAGQEAAQVRRAVGVQDVSVLGKLDVKGTAADAHFAQWEWLEGVVAVLRVKPAHALVVTVPGRESVVRELIVASVGRSPGCAHITEVTSALAAFIVAGPRSTDVLARLTALDLRSQKFADKASAQGELANVHATLHRNDWRELPAYLILVGRDVGEYAWTVIQAAGEPFGLTPFGLAAERLLHDADVTGGPFTQAVGAQPPAASPAS